MTVADASAALSEIRSTLVLIGTEGAQGPHFMIANWATQTSFDPRRYVVALKRSSRTLASVQARGAFTVNLLRADETDAALVKTIMKAKGDGQPGEKGALDAPRLAASYAGFDCRLLQVVDVGGDHVLAVGEVVDGWKRGEGPAQTLFDAHLRYAG